MKRIDSIEELISSISEEKTKRNGSSYVELLLEGSELYSEYKDKFGDPFFKKELVREYLRRGNVEKASEIVVHEENWHHILFARHFSEKRDFPSAELWWKKLSEHSPRHHELMEWKNYRESGGLRRTSSYPDPFNDIISKTGLGINTIFDVGANVGQSCLEYAKIFPSSNIYSFEPVKDTFDILSENTAGVKNLWINNMAVGDISGEVNMSVRGSSTMNRIGTGEQIGEDVRPVKITRLDEFCSDMGIESIDFMKLDTEGHELSAINGCGSFISEILFIQCEASANRYNQYHCQFSDVYDLLYSKGFHLFKIYGQEFEWADGGRPVLRRFDPVFINSRIVGNLGRAVVK